MNTEEMNAFLGSVKVITEVRGEDERHLQEMLIHPGLPVLLGLMFGSRQALYATLSTLPLGDEDMRHRASVLQGKIQGVELLVQTVREQAVPSQSEESERS
jgi:hypothetical protein